jgi:hypothetical protein
MKDNNPVPEDLRRSFDAAILVINALKEEADSIAVKFGTSSKIYKAKLAQVDTLRAFYGSAAAAIERLTNFSIKVGASAIALDIEVMQVRHGLSFRQASDILGVIFSEDKILAVEAVDAIIKACTKPPRADGSQ